MRDCIYTIRCERARWIGPYAYGMYAAIVYVQSMFTPRTYDIYPRTPIMICGCIYTIRHETGTMNRSPTPTECVLQLFMCNQYLSTYTQRLHPRTPTYTHCREPIYRARISWNTRCGLSTHTNVYLRMPYILKCGSRAICTNKMWWYYVSWMWQQSLLSAHYFRANSA